MARYEQALDLDVDDEEPSAAAPDVAKFTMKRAVAGFVDGARCTIAL